MHAAVGGLEQAILRRGIDYLVVQGVHGQIERDPLLVEEAADPLLAAGHREQPSIALHVPSPVEPRLREGGIEGNSVTIPLGVGEGSVHIKDQGLKTVHHSNLSGGKGEVWTAP